MESNMEQSTQAENMGNETEVQGKDGEKMFTQEEVNSFVQSRIARIKSQVTKEAKNEYNQKLSELEARERKLMVKEKLQERNMPKELADVITCTDEDDLNNKLDILNSLYSKEKKTEKVIGSGFRCIGSAADPNNGSGVDPVRQAMGLDRKG